MIEALRAAMPPCSPPGCRRDQQRLTFITQNRFDAALLGSAFPDAHVALESNETVSGLIDQLDGDHWSDAGFDTYSLSFNSLFDLRLKAVKLVRGENMRPKRRFVRFYDKNRGLPEPRRLLGWTVNSRAGIRGLHDYAFDEVLTDLRFDEFAEIWRETAPAARRGKPLCGEAP